MPKWGSAMTRGKVVFWSKEEDEEVTAGEILVEIETEKITNSVESPVSGILRKILIEAGDSAPVGAVIAVITDVEEEWDGEWQSLDNGSEAKESVESNTVVTASNSVSVDGAEKKAVTPAARSLAKKRGIDISQLEPTSKSRITVEDILNYMAQKTGWTGSRFLPVGEWMIH
ncbi:MAG: biotin/lipoyl-containing protein [Desulfitobacteriaceae bacterium]